jgi:hypothetical protein
MIANFGKVLILFGFFFISLGIIFILISKIPFKGKLPGDIYIKKEGFTFYFPFTTSILVSFLLSIIFYLISKFLK